MTEEPGEWKSACPHPEAVGKRWGDPISAERQAELKVLADKQQEWAAQSAGERGASSFQNVDLTGADVFWLAAYALTSPERDGTQALAFLRDRYSDLDLDLSVLHMEHAQLADEHLEGAMLDGAHLEEAQLVGTYLSKATLEAAHLEGAALWDGHLEETNLSKAHLEEAVLDNARMEGASLLEAHLEGAYLESAHLEGAVLKRAVLAGKHSTGDGATRATSRTLLPTNLRGAYFSTATELDGATFGSAELGAVAVVGARWGGVDLSAVEWGQAQHRGLRQQPLMLRDERAAWERTDEDGKPKDAATRREEFQDAVRANRQLAMVLRDQGLNEDADHFAYRAQVLQRQVLWRQRKYGRALGSWLLDAVAGYGYNPLRSVIAYMLIIGLFAGAYLLNAQFAAPHLTWDEALVLSISSFHGRGFFTSGISLGDTLARLAAGEAIIGLLIEITFIATFTQRFFAR